jgi:hypothetical protein
MFPMDPAMDPSAEPEVAARLARRYPVRRSPLRDWRLTAAVLAVIGLAWLVWAAGQGANPAVSARVDGFEVVSDAQIDVRLTVERVDPSRPAECSLFAQAVSYERVGELVVPVASGTDRLTALKVPIRTFKRATTVDIESCRVTG